ncbi:putative integral membrane protein [Babesia bovis T2Bo]|uniref:Membrane protein, putative n=1 Tax=Babesia bovis TaxID=5865 RepID=A7ATW4_BABBO|nr:putative integral membrane protein [Babesia bovis T2Bo]EDO06375.1 putative integral membrane protein [Babesia bovis T2Bo]|eukprot:XP_001609943.1 membrane protein [Babesia bovis T2Bo]
MDTSSCTTIVLVLVWFYLCCQALASLESVLVSTVPLGLCLWQCKKAGYLVSPMTWDHWVLVLSLVLLQLVAVVLEKYEKLDWGPSRVAHGHKWAHPIYAISVVLVGILGGTLYCGWKCNLFCRPCCKSQYICYGSAVVVVLVVLTVLAVTASLVQFQVIGGSAGETEKPIIQYLGKIVVCCTQCYSMLVLWITVFRLPYTLPEVVVLIASALAVASMVALAVALRGKAVHYNNTEVYMCLAAHLVTLSITWYCLEYKATFCCPKEYVCLGVLTVVLLITLVAVVVVIVIDIGDVYGDEYKFDDVKYTLLGYSMVLMIPTLWYAYRCGLFKWCIPKKKGLKATDTAENTIPDSDIAKES